MFHSIDIRSHSPEQLLPERTESACPGTSGPPQRDTREGPPWRRAHPESIRCGCGPVFHRLAKKEQILAKSVRHRPCRGVARDSASHLDRVTAHDWRMLGVEAGQGRLGRAPWPTTTVHLDRLLG